MLVPYVQNLLSCLKTRLVKYSLMLLLYTLYLNIYNTVIGSFKKMILIFYLNTVENVWSSSRRKTTVTSYISDKDTSVLNCYSVGDLSIVDKQLNSRHNQRCIVKLDSTWDASSSIHSEISYLLKPCQIRY